jgi:hypothetical protein
MRRVFFKENTLTNAATKTLLSISEPAEIIAI